MTKRKAITRALLTRTLDNVALQFIGDTSNGGQLSLYPHIYGNGFMVAEYRAGVSGVYRFRHFDNVNDAVAFFFANVPPRRVCGVTRVMLTEKDRG